MICESCEKEVGGQYYPVRVAATQPPTPWPGPIPVCHACAEEAGLLGKSVDPMLSGVAVRALVVSALRAAAGIGTEERAGPPTQCQPFPAAAEPTDRLCDVVPMRTLWERQQDEAVEDGALARTCGKGLGDNPFVEDCHQYVGWRTGWLRAGDVDVPTPPELLEPEGGE